MIEVFKVAQGSYQIKLCWRWLGSHHSRAQNFAAVSPMVQGTVWDTGDNPGWTQCHQGEVWVGWRAPAGDLNLGITLIALRVFTWMFSSPSALLSFPFLLRIPAHSWPSVPSPLQEARAQGVC